MFLSVFRPLLFEVEHSSRFRFPFILSTLRYFVLVLVFSSTPPPPPPSVFLSDGPRIGITFYIGSRHPVEHAEHWIHLFCVH